MDLSIFDQSSNFLKADIMTAPVSVEKTSETPEIDHNLPFEEFLTYRLLMVSNRLNRQAAHILEAENGLRLPEWRCLALIGCYGRMSLNRISEMMAIDPSLTSRSIRGLVEKGHVLTERDAADRRIVYATLTKQGESVYHTTMPVVRRRQMSLLAALSPSDRKAIYRIIDRLSGAVDDWETNWGNK